VIGYLRVSTDLQAERGFGLDVQRERIEAFCRAERCQLVDVFIDPRVSGTTPVTSGRV
jgi:DNA invertase Pin-like site-specific DNA recombinase